jgi:hypothetical protein
VKSKLGKFLALPPDQKWVLTEAILFLFSTKIILAIFPLKTVMKISFSIKRIERTSDDDILLKIKWALCNADRLSFWKNKCLVKSIAGCMMLGRRGIVSQIFFGVKHDDNKKAFAHAWLKTGDFEIVEKGGDYIELFIF